MKFFGDRRQKAERLRKTIPLGHAKLVRYDNDEALFVCVDRRANVHLIELDRHWMQTRGVGAACELVAEAVAEAGTRLATARRN